MTSITLVKVLPLAVFSFIILYKEPPLPPLDLTVTIISLEFCFTLGQVQT